MSVDRGDLLSTAEVDAALAEIGGWDRLGDELRRVLRFDDFRLAFAFLTEVARLAEEQDHHPELRCSYRDVELRLTTHSAGGLTAKDLRLAREIEELLRRGDS